MRRYLKIKYENSGVVLRFSGVLRAVSLSRAINLKKIIILIFGFSHKSVTHDGYKSSVWVKTLFVVIFPPAFLQIKYLFFLPVKELSSCLYDFNSSTS